MSIRKIKYKIQLREEQLEDLGKMTYTRDERFKREQFLQDDIGRLKIKLAHEEMLRPLRITIIVTTLIGVGFVLFKIFVR